MILVFIGERHIQHYALEKLHNTKKVLIIAKNNLANLEPTLLKQFDMIHSVDVEYIDGALTYLDKVEVTNLISEYHQQEEIRILSNDEATYLLAAQMRSQFNIPGAKEQHISFFRDKVLFKEKMQAHNIRVPHFQELDKTQLTTLENIAAFYNKLVESIGKKMVVKPRSGAGSQDVFIVTSSAQFNEAIIHMLDDDNNEYEVEEFIDGTLYQCDTVTHDGKVYFSACIEHGIPCAEFTKGKPIGMLPLPPSSALHKNLVHTTVQMLEVLGMPDGIQHTELFVTPTNEIIILESQARSGGLKSIDIYKETFGVNLLNLELTLTTGVDIPQPSHVGPFHFYVLYPIQPGVLQHNLLPKLMSEACVTWLQPEGKTFTQASKSILEQSAVVGLKTQDYKSAKKDFQRLLKHPLAVFKQS